MHVLFKHSPLMCSLNLVFLVNRAWLYTYILFCWFVYSPYSYKLLIHCVFLTWTNWDLKWTCESTGESPVTMNCDVSARIWPILWVKNIYSEQRENKWNLKLFYCSMILCFFYLTFFFIWLWLFFFSLLFGVDQTSFDFLWHCVE